MNSQEIDLLLAVRNVLPFLETVRTHPIPEQYLPWSEANELRARADQIDARNKAVANLRAAFQAIAGDAK